MATALITGGSSGIGLKFAWALAGQGYNLILVAREANQLEDVAINITKMTAASVHPLALDLADADSVEKVTGVIARTHDLEILINNAGFGVHVDASDNSRATHELQRDAMNVMGLNTLLFSSAAATVMKKRGKGQIINIASTAAWTYAGNYSAIKSYVVTYSESLALALRGSGVTATVVCPAWMHTNFHKSAGLDEPAIPEWLYIDPDQVVDEALRAAKRGQSCVIPTRRWRFIIWVLRHGPVVGRRAFTRWYLGNGNYTKTD